MVDRHVRPLRRNQRDHVQGGAVRREALVCEKLIKGRSFSLFCVAVKKFATLCKSRCPPSRFSDIPAGLTHSIDHRTRYCVHSFSWATRAIRSSEEHGGKLAHGQLHPGFGVCG
jgi:hypothetical protein